MASIRNLKKDIDYLISELVVDCLSYVNLHAKADKEEAFKIIEEALSVRVKMRELANHPDGKDNPKLVKAHFKNTVEKLIQAVENGYERLEKLAIASK